MLIEMSCRGRYGTTPFDEKLRASQRFRERRQIQPEKCTTITLQQPKTIDKLRIGMWNTYATSI